MAASMAEERNAGLDGLRGYAAIVVVVFHSVLGLDATQIERILRGHWSNFDPYEGLTKIFLKIFDGEAAVMLFFVLSGAVLFRSLIREEDGIGGVAVKFYVRRVFRIYPALFVCLVACSLAFAAGGRGITLDDFISNALLYDFKVNGATWTLNAEMIAPLFLLLSYLGYRAGREWGLAFVAFGLMYLLELPQLDGYLTYFRGSWYCFALGALIPTRAGRAVASALPTWSWIGAIACAIVLRWPLREASIAVLVAMVYYRRTPAIEAFLSGSISQFLGRISFSFYLFNVLFLELICDRVRQYPWAAAHPLEAGIGVAAVVIACTIPVAWISWTCIEMPFNRLGHRLTGRSRITSAAQPAVP